MPRGPRSDAPQAVHHVMLRGIERRRIFEDAADYEEFVSRLDRLIPELNFRCFAWALMPNHVHLALQTGSVPLSRLMARLGTGYARYFNGRHQRVGHLFQNRFKSRLVDGDGDLLGLVLYIHRNPIRAQLVDDGTALGQFPWCGHGSLVGVRRPRAFECPALTLQLFADRVVDARRSICRWMDAPPQNDAEDSSLAPTPIDARGLDPSRPADTTSLNRLIEGICQAHGLSREDLGAGRRSRRAVEARMELTLRATHELCLSSREVARALGVSDSTISRALAAREGAPKKRL